MLEKDISEMSLDEIKAFIDTLSKEEFIYALCIAKAYEELKKENEKLKSKKPYKDLKERNDKLVEQYSLCEIRKLHLERENQQLREQLQTAVNDCKRKDEVMDEVRKEIIKLDSSFTCAIDDYYFKERVLNILKKRKEIANE